MDRKIHKIDDLNHKEPQYLTPTDMPDGISIFSTAHTFNPGI